METAASSALRRHFVSHGAARPGRQPLVLALREDHQGRNLALRLVEQRVVLERRVEVVLAIEDGDGDVSATREEPLQFGGLRDRDGFQVGLGERGRHGPAFFGR